MRLIAILGKREKIELTESEKHLTATSSNSFRPLRSRKGVSGTAPHKPHHFLHARTIGKGRNATFFPFVYTFHLVDNPFDNQLIEDFACSQTESLTQFFDVSAIAELHTLPFHNAGDGDPRLAPPLTDALADREPVAEEWRSKAADFADSVEKHNSGQGGEGKVPEGGREAAVPVRQG